MLGAPARWLKAGVPPGLHPGDAINDCPPALIAGVGKAPRVAPKNCSIKEGCARWGTGRTRLYELLRTNQIESVKFGARTLIVVESGDLFFASLPPAFSK